MKKVGIIGIGNLGKAMVSLISNNLTSKDLLVLSDKRYEQSDISNSNYIFLCIKPNNTEEVLNDIKNTHFDLNPLIITCIAGIPFEKYDIPFPVIRCMPNIPVSLGKGVVTYTCNNKVSEKNIKDFEDLVKGPYILGVPSEKILDITTVFTGSMPAFISYFSEEFIYFGKKHGIPEEIAKKMYIETVKGTMEMLKNHSNQDIINMVKSPGGITERGLKDLEKYSLDLYLSYALNESLDALNSIRKD